MISNCCSSHSIICMRAGRYAIAGDSFFTYNKVKIAIEAQIVTTHSSFCILNTLFLDVFACRQLHICRYGAGNVHEVLNVAVDQDEILGL